jgi:hypothetical protein
MSYITRRDGRYSYRRRFPNDVAELIGRTEYRKALGTADRTEALKLARVMSVEFDRICETALQEQTEAVASASTGSGDGSIAATHVLSSLDAVVRGFTLDVVERMHTPGWQKELEWKKRALQAHADGLMPPGVQMHPVTARAALRALQGVLDGNPPPIAEQDAAPRIDAVSVPTTGGRTAKEFAPVLAEYCEGVGGGRASKLKNLTARVLVWPSTADAQVQRVMQYCGEKLEAGGKPSSVHSDAAALITVLRRVPGWAGIALPKTGAVAKTVRSGAGMGKDQRDPIPLEQMLKVHASIRATAPAHYPAAVLLARYGLRPGELLQEGPEALSERTDILGKRELVFKVALSGGKNAAARRDLPVHADDAPLFREVLGALDLPAGCTRTQRDTRVRQRVRNLSRVFRRFLGDSPTLTLYSQRHSCADLLRHVQATGEEVGGILGHTAAGAKATSIYGGSQPLDRPRELLGKVRALIP